MNYTTISHSWEDYERRVLPVNAGAIQRRECKLAFYGGASTTLAILMEMGGPDFPMERGVDRLAIIQGECQEWLDEIKKEMR